MNLLPKIVVLTLVIAYNYAKPRYVAIPWEYVQVMEQRPKSDMEQPFSTARLRRDISNETPQYENQYQPQAQASQFEQQNYNSNPNEYVDFGAHTGHSGSFGWYADFPVQ